MFETGPFIWIIFLSSIKIDNLPSSNSMSVFGWTNFLMLPATTVAHAAVPQALVRPAPLSQTLTFIKFYL